MTEGQIREIFRQELALFFGQQESSPAADKAKVLPIVRRLEIRRQAEAAMAEKLRGRK